MILLFCGPPASGKSAIARELVKKLEDCHLVISDEFKRKTYWHMFKEAERYAGKVRYLVLDGTFYKRKWRNRIQRIAKRNEEQVFIIFVNCSLDTCLERNKQREGEIEEKAVHMIYRKLERPEKVNVFINTDQLGVEEAVNRVCKNLNLKNALC